MKCDAHTSKVLGIIEAGRVGGGGYQGERSEGEMLPLTQAAPPLSHCLLCHRHTCPP